ncbi:MAG TPA: TetR/AcrR family transcriptional regulator [Solirubrobacterales bacterium]|nr:TetR/AcrR family transcriptional regulator [Solirubrobacterales bacterium]
MPQSPTGTRESILDRAVDLASTDGLEGLTIGTLAAEMSMSKSGLFRHFGSKEELQLATIKAAADRFLAEIVQPALELPPGGERLRALVEGYLDHLERRVFAGGCFWAAATTEFDDRPGAVHDAVGGAVSAWLVFLAEQAREAGYSDPDQVAFELQSITQGANLRHRLFDDAQAFDRARSAVERVLSSSPRG